MIPPFEWPFANDDILLSVRKALKLSHAERQNRLLRESLAEKFGKDAIVGNSKAIQDVLTLAGRVAPSRSTVLVTGESGTGKELVARALHIASDRKESFVAPERVEPDVTRRRVMVVGVVG